MGTAPSLTLYRSGFCSRIPTLRLTLSLGPLASAAMAGSYCDPPPALQEFSSSRTKYHYFVGEGLPAGFRRTTLVRCLSAR